MNAIVLTLLDDDTIVGQLIKSTPAEMLTALKELNADTGIEQDEEPETVARAKSCTDLQLYVDSYFYHGVVVRLTGHGEYQGLYE